MRYQQKGQARREPALSRNAIRFFRHYSGRPGGYPAWLSQRRLRRSVSSKLLLWPGLLRAGVGHVFREGVLLILPEGPGGSEMIVVDEGVHGMMHVSVVRALQVRRALELERQRLGVRRIISVHSGLVARHAVVRHLQLPRIQVVERNHLH